MISDENNMGGIDYAELEALLEANKTYIRRFSGLHDPADKLIEMIPALIATAKERDDEIAAAEIRGLEMAAEVAWNAPVGALACRDAIIARIAKLKAKTEPRI